MKIINSQDLLQQDPPDLESVGTDPQLNAIFSDSSCESMANGKFWGHAVKS